MTEDRSSGFAMVASPWHADGRRQIEDKIWGFCLWFCHSGADTWNL